MRVIHILNLGAGVQSTALYLMSFRQDEPEHVPVFDYAIFADTQEEPKAVYDHLQWLKSLGGPPILEATAGKLGDDLSRGENSTGQRFASIPAFTAKDEGIKSGITRRQCTREYKTEVVERTIKREIVGIKKGGRFPSDVRVVQYLGLSFDEPMRVFRVKGRFESVAWSDPRFPLYDLEMKRADCVRYLGQAAPGRKVPRSACVFCPFHDNKEWRRLRDEDSEGWERACNIDDALRVPGNIVNRNLDQKLYIHASCVPLRVAPIGVDLPGLFDAECEGMCGV